MPLYMISYDYHKERDYTDLYDQLENKWKAKRVLESVWFAALKLNAKATLAKLSRLGDDDDSFLVLELKSGSDWDCQLAQADGVEWLRNKIKAD